MSNAIRAANEIERKIGQPHRFFVRLRFCVTPIVLVALFSLSGIPLASGNLITFNVTGTFANTAAFLAGSSLTIDTTAGIATDSHLLISAGSNSPANTFTQADITQVGAFGQPLMWNYADGTELTLFMPVPPDFVGFAGGTIGFVTYSGPWGFSNGSTNTVLTPLPVPEPTIIFLLTIGLAVLSAVMRRRQYDDVASDLANPPRSTRTWIADDRRLLEPAASCAP